MTDRQPGGSEGDGEKERGRHLRNHRTEEEVRGRKERSLRLTMLSGGGGGLYYLMGEQAKEHLRKLEDEKENLQTELNVCTSHLESSINKYNTSQKTIQELNVEVSRHPKEQTPTFNSRLGCLYMLEAPQLLSVF